MHCSEYWWNSHWKGIEHNKVCNWLCSGIPWSNDIMYEDRWVDISISSSCKDNKRGVAGLLRDVSGGSRFGFACWFGNNTGWRETEVLLECIGHLANIEDNFGRIYLRANDGDWKQHLRNTIEQHTDTTGHFMRSNNYLYRLSICNGWPIAEANHLLSIIPANVKALVMLQEQYQQLQLWAGDPCLPVGFTWDWLNCNADDPPRVTELHLSGSGLKGTLPDFRSLTALEIIISGNKIEDDPIPPPPNGGRNMKPIIIGGYLSLPRSPLQSDSRITFA
ncbi:hypothetical protein EJ110_NYTH28933 [Nymphaea thermarum]|nr:hypothetical protein EJ110_NYTH28933 [Nymphaea thermarum]